MKTRITEEMAQKIAQSIISNEIALDFNEQIKHTPLYRQKLKGSINMVQKEYYKAEGLFDDLYNHEIESTQHVYNVQKEMTNEICSFGFQEFGNITQLLRAYKKNPKSMEGIVNKILKS